MSIYKDGIFKGCWIDGKLSVKINDLKMAQKKQFEDNEDLILNINKFVDHKFEIK